MNGSTVCYTHGGSAPQVRRAAARRLAEDRLLKALDQVEIRDVTDPVAEFQRLVSETVAFKDAIASHVAALESDYRYDGDKAGEQLRAEVALYERAMDRAGKFLVEWNRLGLEERLVRLDEARFALVVRALDAYREAAEVDADHHRLGVQAMAKVLRAA